MIRISSGPIKLRKLTVGFPRREHTYWDCGYFGYVPETNYTNLVAFEAAPVTVTPLSLIESILCQKMSDLNATSTVYQFNASANRTPNPETYVRMCAILNNPDPINRIQPISWLDAYIKYPILKAFCVVANAFIRRINELRTFKTS